MDPLGSLETIQESVSRSIRNITDLLTGELFSYEREFRKGERSPFKYIAAMDAPPSYPMVLCVSSIVDSEGAQGIEASKSQSHIEVTDGWYRLRASIDDPIRRALSRRKLRVGMKMACFGAKVMRITFHSFPLILFRLRSLPKNLRVFSILTTL